MITVQKFLQCVQENAERIHGYELGHDGSDGKSDCIGLIIGALRLAGVKWPGTHGSNWAARNAMESLLRIEDGSEMFPGMIVYKARSPGEEGYALPESYKNSPDRKDYYHVGVVTGVEPLEITHCTGVAGGIKRDTKQGAWKYGGKLKYVNYEQDGEKPMQVLYKAKVWADNGYPVRLRTGPGSKYDIIAEVPLGSAVDVLEETNGAWSTIQFGGQAGYMMRKFLIREEEAPIGDTVTISRTKLKELKACLSDALNVIEQALKQ